MSKSPIARAVRELRESYDQMLDAYEQKGKVSKDLAASVFADAAYLHQVVRETTYLTINDRVFERSGRISYEEIADLAQAPGHFSVMVMLPGCGFTLHPGESFEIEPDTYVNVRER